MRKTTFVLSIAIACLAVAYSVAWTSMPPSTWVVDPGNVEISHDNAPGKGKEPQTAGTKVRGSIKLRPSGTGTASKTGGGCLVYLPTQQTSCSVDNDCATASRPGYCAPTQNTSAQPSAEAVNSHPKACWYQPEQASCYRSPVNPLPENEVIFFPWTSAYPQDAGRPVPWRVVSCHNLEPGGCASGEPQKRKYEFGTIKSVP